MAQSVKLWDRDLNVTANLRQPNAPVANAAKDEDSIIKNSNLSVNAKEWYPPNHVPQTTNASHVSNVQNRLLIHKQPIQHNVEDFNDSPDMNRLKQIITTLTNDPGKFDNLYGIFMETLYPYLEDIILVPNCAQMLVDQAVNYPNFRYTGARLCYQIEECCPNFRAALHLACTKKLDDSTNKQNILLFIAELYTQLHHLNIYGTLLIDSFKKLISQGGNDNVKCICQALKLTGYSLEKYNKEVVDNLFTQLQDIKSNIDGSALILLNSVLNLRNTNWGHATQSDATSSPTDDEDYYYPEAEGPIHYKLEGQAFTNDEKEFLAANMLSNDDILSDSDPDELCDPEPEMDEEIQEAFKEFVKFSKR